MVSSKRKYGFLAVLITLWAVLVVDQLRMGKTSGDMFWIAREAVIWIIILLSWNAARRGWLEEKDLLSRLKFIGGQFVALSALLWTGRLLEVISLRPNYFLAMGLTVIVFLAISIIITARGLIYIQQKKRTEANFRFLILLICLYMTYAIAGGHFADSPPWADSRTDSSIFGRILFGLILLYSVINGFRCRWIHYLNKKQKIGVFFLGLPVFGLSLAHLLQFPDFVSDHSAVIGALGRSFLFFFTLYSGMSLLGLLLQLPSAGLMDRRIQELRSFQDLSVAMGSVFEPKELAQEAVRLASKMVEADYVWMELKRKGFYETAGSTGTAPGTELLNAAVLKKIREDVLRSPGSLIINDLTKENPDKPKGKQSGSLLAARILLKDRLLGMLYAFKGAKFGFVEESKGLFLAFTDQVAVALENANLIQVTIEQEVYREELRVAHDAQMRLLPRRMPGVPGTDIAAFCVTANEIGGDFFDFIQVGKDRLDIVIGDVSGKGAEAAFYMAELKGVIQALAPHCSSPKQIMLEVNTFLKTHFEPHMFATMNYGIYTPSKKQLRIVRAGHPPAGLLVKGKVSWTETKGLGLGLVHRDRLAKVLTEKTLHLKPGEAVFFYTDGLTEARNSRHEEFGEKALSRMLAELSSLDAETLMARVRRQVEEFSGDYPKHDDITAVVLRVTA